MTHRDQVMPLVDTNGLGFALVDLILLEVFMTAIEKLGPPPSTKACVIGQAMTDLPEPYGSALQQIIDRPWKDGGLTEFEVAIVMNEAGLRSSATSVSRHRRGLCVCRMKGNA